MLETLVPLELPPGLVNNGTTYQSKNHWFKGSLIRFFQGAIQPVGGWTQRTTTGDTITGTPNCAHAWQDNAGNSWLAIGTTTGLWVVSSANVVYDVLTVGLTGGTPYQWQLDNFGSYLLAIYNLTSFNPGDALNVLVWKGDTAAKAVQAATAPSDTPSAVFGGFMSPERFLVLLRGSDPNTGSNYRPTSKTY